MFDKEIANRIEQLIKLQDISIPQFARKLKKSSSTIYRWLNSETIPKINEIKNLCITFNISYEWIIDGKLPIYKEEFVSKMPIKTIPILSNLQGILNPKNARAKKNLPITDVECNKDVFCAVIINDSVMYPTLKPGDIALLSYATRDAVKKIVVGKANDKIILLRLGLYGSQVILTPDNPEYDAISIPKSDLKIIGIVKSIVREIK